MSNETYPSPLTERYASREMAELFSHGSKFRTWRRLWLVLLETEKELGLPITDEQVEEVRKHLDDIDLERAALIERETRHDVMAHLRLLRARGAKGTTGTQASFLTLFDGDHGKVEELDRRIAERLGFPGSYPVTGQTYPRKVDGEVVGALGGVAASSSKFATDLRLLMSLGELEEPIDDHQVGSSAMAYKRNPVRSERIVALSRHVTAGGPEALHNASNPLL